MSSELHVRTCKRCSSGALYLGQFAESLCFLITINLPVDVSLLIHLVINNVRLKEASFVAVASEGQCILALEVLRDECASSHLIIELWVICV